MHGAAERLFGFELRVPLHAHDTWRNRAAHWLGWRYALHLVRTASARRTDQPVVPER